MSDDNLPTVAKLLDHTPETVFGRWSVQGRRLQFRDSHYAIELGRFRTPTDLAFWVRHLNGKGWIQPRDITDLIDAFDELNPEVP